LYYAIRASRLQPSNTNYTLTLAEILYKLNRIQAAIDKLDEVLSQDPNHAKAKQIKRAISR
jgi:cytochrome c-type biogenesis protein CcmH/NrfG